MALEGRTLAPLVVVGLLALSGCSALGGGGETPASEGTTTSTAPSNGTAANGSTTATQTATGTPTPTPTPSPTATATPTEIPTATKPSPTGIRVSEIRADPPGKDANNLAEEYIVLKNTGDNPVDLSGWSVKDEDGHVHTFADGVTLKVGETLTLHSGSGSQTASDRFWWAAGPVWDNRGETISIFDETGQKVFERTYD